MKTLKQKLAACIYTQRGNWRNQEYLYSSKGVVALRGNDDFDELENKHLYVLACLSAEGLSKTSTISIRTELEEAKVQGYLDLLCDLDYAEAKGDDYQATDEGARLMHETGIQMLDAVLFDAKREVKEAQDLRDSLDGR